MRKQTHCRSLNSQHKTIPTGHGEAESSTVVLGALIRPARHLASHTYRYQLVGKSAQVTAHISRYFIGKAGGQRGGLQGALLAPRVSQSTGKVSTVMLREERERMVQAGFSQATPWVSRPSKPSRPSTCLFCHSTKEGKHPVLLQLLETFFTLKPKQERWLLCNPIKPQ